jgi:hypothetical protein
MEPIMTITPEDLAEAKRLCAEATPEPWDVHEGRDYIQLRGPEGSISYPHDEPNEQDEKDYAFIAFTRSLLPKLIARVEQLEAGLPPPLTDSEHREILAKELAKTSLSDARAIRAGTETWRLTIALSAMRAVEEKLRGGK